MRKNMYIIFVDYIKYQLWLGYWNLGSSDTFVTHEIEFLLLRNEILQISVTIVKAINCKKQ